MALAKVMRIYININFQRLKHILIQKNISCLNRQQLLILIKSTASFIHITMTTDRWSDIKRHYETSIIK